MKPKKPLQYHGGWCLVIEGGMLCIPLFCTVVQLLVVRLIHAGPLWQGLLPPLCGLAADLLFAPFRWGRRIWYHRLAAGEDPRGSFGYALRHSGRALLWRLLICVSRCVVLTVALAPTTFALRTADQLRQLTPTPALDLALLACLVVAAVSCGILLPIGLWSLLSLWPLAETLEDSGSWCQAWRRSRRLLSGRGERALGWWCKGAGWLLLCLIPGVGLWACARWQLHRARWLAQRAEQVLPPMREGVKIYLPRTAE